MISYETLIIGGRDSKGNVLSLAATESALAEMAEIFNKAGRRYFKEFVFDKSSRSDLRKMVVNRFALTSKQFTSIRLGIDGQIDGSMKSMQSESESLAGRIESAGKKIERWIKKIDASIAKDDQDLAWRRKNKARNLAGKPPTKKPKPLENFCLVRARAERKRLREIVEAKREYVQRLKSRKTKLDYDIKNYRPRLCFGGRKLFEARLHWEVSGFLSFEEWREMWRKARANQIFLVGSHDESHGNESATLTNPNITNPQPQPQDWLELRVKLPGVMDAQFGKWLIVYLKHFRRGHAEVLDACQWRLTKQSKATIAAKAAQTIQVGGVPPASVIGVSWRLMRKNARRGEIWVAQANFEPEVAPMAPLVDNGGIGIDLNSKHVSWCWVDRFGNPVRTKNPAMWKDIPLDTGGKSRHQVEALMGEAAKEIVARAQEMGIPLFYEELDFRKKKTKMRENGKRHARMLSQFAYATFAATLVRRCARVGATAISVDPAYTSVIGQAKFAFGYNMTVHQAAACAIARKGLVFKTEERLRARRVGKEQGHSSQASVGFPAPARTRGKKVTHDWRRMGWTLRIHRLARSKLRRERRSLVGVMGADASLPSSAAVAVPKGNLALSILHNPV